MSAVQSKTTCRLRFAFFAGAILLGAATAHQAQASENGISFYLLGSGGPGAAELPPIQGVFFVNNAYYYEGKMGGGKQSIVGGSVVVGLDAKVTSDFPTMLAVPTTNFAGGILAIGAILPMGRPDVEVGAVVAGPRGRSISVSKTDSAFVVGDPVLMAAASWSRGKLHYSVSSLVNVPIGEYRKNQLANLAFHRWAADISLATTWLDKEAGWDLSGKAGLTFNGENDYTDYDTGTEFHAEAAIEKKLSPAFSAGLLGYYFKQVSGDSGPGAVLGSFKGEVTGIGGTAAYKFKILDKIPASLRLKGLAEFNATNRMKGTTVFLEFSMPLYVKLPPGAAGHP